MFERFCRGGEKINVVKMRGDDTKKEKFIR